MLAAAALAGLADRVVVVERDELPGEAAPRKGLPQARHAHMLWSGGLRAMEDLLPGVTGTLTDAGARRAPVTTDMVVLSAHGWFRRWPESHHVILAGRDLLDATVRARVLADDRVEVLDGTEVLGLTGDARAVTGVRVRERDGRERSIDAGMVVDATGRASGTPRWLTELGLPTPESREVDSGLAYASRLYLAPEQARDGFPVINVQPDTRVTGPGRAGFLLPIEDGRWIVTLNGTRGGEPSPADDDFVRFAREELRHPLIGDLISRAEPLSGVSFTRTTVNRRYFYERMPAWPENFTVLGDALAAYNPVYGHGLAMRRPERPRPAGPDAAVRVGERRVVASGAEGGGPAGRGGVGAGDRAGRVLSGGHGERADGTGPGRGRLRLPSHVHRHRQRPYRPPRHRRDVAGAAGGGVAGAECPVGGGGRSVEADSDRTAVDRRGVEEGGAAVVSPRTAVGPRPYRPPVPPAVSPPRGAGRPVPPVRS